MSGSTASSRATPIELFTDSGRWADIDAWEQAALELHERGGIYRIEAPGYAPFWAVVDHAAVLDVERRAAVFHNAPRPVLSTLAQDAARRRELKALIHMDGHEHSAHRMLTADWFKPASIGRMTARLDELSRASSLRRILEDRPALDLRALESAPRIARGEKHAGVVAQALSLPGVSLSDHAEGVALAHEPHRRGDRSAVLAEGRERQVLASAEIVEGHR